MRSILTSLFRRLPAATLAIALAAIASQAGAFPDRPIKIVVPLSPGGGADLVARTLAPLMSQQMGQPVIVENRPGAGTLLGTEFVAKAAPDGYTLLLATLSHVVNPSLYPTLPYSHDTAFKPVTLLGRSPNVLVVRADSQYQSVQDVVTAARAHPGEISFASGGTGTSAHLAGELFKNLTRTQILHIPYKGAGPYLTDLIGGHVDLVFGTAAGVGSLVESGKLRALAVTTETRSQVPALAPIPTMAEAGVPGYVADSWYGILVPGGTPDPIVARLYAAIRSSIQSPEFRRRLEQEGLVISGIPPAEFARYLRQEEARWKAVVQKAEIKAN